MNGRSKLLLGFGLAALLARPALAQDDRKPATSPTPPSAGGGDATPPSAPSPKSAAKAGAAAEAAKYDAHIQFDKDSAKGEILCKGGKEEGGAIEYDRCAKDKMERYDEVPTTRSLWRTVNGTRPGSSRAVVTNAVMSARVRGRGQGSHVQIASSCPAASRSGACAGSIGTSRTCVPVSVVGVGRIMPTSLGAAPRAVRCQHDGREQSP